MEYLLFQEQDILERVDEYALYCFYLGHTPLIGGKYPSPIRQEIHYNQDTVPSFGIFERKKGNSSYEFLWKDMAANIYGDIFDLIVLLLKSVNSRREAMHLVMSDFGIGGNKVPRVAAAIPERQYLEPIEIQVKSRPFNSRDLLYWGQFGVTEPILKTYTVLPIAAYWMTKSQTKPDFPKVPGYAYREWNLYQLYFPTADKYHKFRHNYTDVCVHGFKQLQYNQDLCIITKSRKDVMVMRSLGYEAVSPRSENTPLPQLCIDLLKKRYKRIVVLFDNDGKHNGESYEFPKVYVPLDLRQDDKDVSDYYSHHGKQSTIEMLKSILNGQ
jgi:hypothetical protein